MRLNVDLFSQAKFPLRLSSKNLSRYLSPGFSPNSFHTICLYVEVIVSAGSNNVDSLSSFKYYEAQVSAHELNSWKAGEIIREVSFLVGG